MIPFNANEDLPDINPKYPLGILTDSPQLISVGFIGKSKYFAVEKRSLPTEPEVR